MGTSTSSSLENNISDEELLEFQIFLRTWDDDIIRQLGIARELDVDVPAESVVPRHGGTPYVSGNTTGIVAGRTSGNTGGNLVINTLGGLGVDIAGVSGEKPAGNRVTGVRTIESPFSNDSSNYWASQCTGVVPSESCAAFTPRSTSGDSSAFPGPPSSGDEVGRRAPESVGDVGGTRSLYHADWNTGVVAVEGNGLMLPLSLPTDIFNLRQLSPGTDSGHSNLWSRGEIPPDDSSNGQISGAGVSDKLGEAWGRVLVGGKSTLRGCVFLPSESPSCDSRSSVSTCTERSHGGPRISNLKNSRQGVLDSSSSPSSRAERSMAGRSHVNPREASREVGGVREDGDRDSMRPPRNSTLWRSTAGSRNTADGKSGKSGRQTRKLAD